jgi:hypothetical protein
MIETHYNCAREHGEIQALRLETIIGKVFRPKERIEMHIELDYMATGNMMGDFERNICCCPIPTQPSPIELPSQAHDQNPLE